jgi:hypothetical protein
MILPLRVLGKPSAKRISSGPRELADFLRDVLAELFLHLVVAGKLRLQRDEHDQRWPFKSSARPTAAASATALCDTSALSISAVPMR